MRMVMSKIVFEITEEDILQFQNLLSGNEEMIVWGGAANGGPVDIVFVAEGNSDE
jgi:hypothetical protein